MNVSLLAGLGLLVASAAPSAEVPRIDTRFAKSDVSETPDFRQHVVPLMGKLGCNGRACHGSFQGQGGFRLSLFGYDFKSDHENLLAGDEPRTNLEKPELSLILQKPLLIEEHEGGKRFDADTWQHRVLLKWITAGAKPIQPDDADFVRLDITPSEMVAHKKGDTWQLKAVAVWSDGTQEDVTPLCRFQSNNDQVATITEAGLVTATGPGDTHVVAFYDNGVVPVPVIHPVSDKIGPKYPKTPTPTKVDELVVQKLRKLGVVQADTCTDAEFLRRASLDIIGTLPTPKEVEAFLNDSTADKRAKKVDELLERPEYAAWWATKMADWTGNNARYLNQLQSPGGPPMVAKQWYDWLAKKIATNVPYDELAEGLVLAKSRREGESYLDYCARMSSYYQKGADVDFADQECMPYYWGRSNFNNVDDRALGFAYTFLGIRIQCSQCHKHPFDQWTKDDFDRFKGFFARVTYRANGSREEQEQILKDLGVDPKGKNNGDLAKMYLSLAQEGKVIPFRELTVTPPQRAGNDRRKDKDKGKKQQVVAGRTAKVLGGDEINTDDLEDPRTALMDWMRDPENPYFAQAFVNRVWSGYFNRGIVEPTDDLSLANPPCNAELLDYLAAAFREHNYDMKWLHREICNSRTYQLSWQSNETNRLDERNFSRAVPRRLPAEVAYDAVVQATSSNQELDKSRGEVRGRAIADSYVDTRGNRGSAAYALTVFGRSIRESNCDCDRSMETSLLQTVFLQNDDQVLSELTDRGGWVDEVVKTAQGLSPSDDAGDQRKQSERKLDRAKEFLAKAKASKNDKRIEQAKEMIAQAEAEAAKLRKVESEPVKADESAIAEIVRQAYLRTLNRPPTDAELGRSVSYFSETGDLKTGARDLLWALLNTKEFIVNH